MARRMRARAEEVLWCWQRAHAQREGDFGRMLAKYLGPRYAQLLRNWVPTAAAWGSVGTIGLVWATDWRLILDYVPWINGKFKKDD